jgi:hypothetical protein
LAGALAVTGVVACAAIKPAGALQSYTEKTGLSCGRCHTNPAGGGKLTAFGNEYAANGHKVPKKGKGADTTTVSGGTPAAVPASEVVPGRALDYVPWTLRDPYYSHFLYKSDDYSK